MYLKSKEAQEKELNIMKTLHKNKYNINKIMKYPGPQKKILTPTRNTRKRSGPTSFKAEKKEEKSKTYSRTRK
jgi:protein subunit release factor B